MTISKMKFCMDCGTQLETKYLKGEGTIPFCPACNEYRFPVFNTAVSMIVMNKNRDKVLLIKQYGRNSYILVAGYVNQGEDAEEAVIREIKEEVGLHVTDISFNHSHYFAKSNTLMLNFTAVVDGDVHINDEVDAYHWFTIDKARMHIRDKSLAQAFLIGYLDKEYDFSFADHKR